MSAPRVRRILLLGAVGIAAAKAVKALRGSPAPAFTRHPSAWDGSDRPPPAAPGPAATAAAPTPVPPAERAATEGTTAGTAWAEPLDGDCPPGHPVKAKLKSGIFHVPGGAAYDRTIADRCYPSTEAAEADGFRAAKR